MTFHSRSDTTAAQTPADALVIAFGARGSRTLRAKALSGGKAFGRRWTARSRPSKLAHCSVFCIVLPWPSLAPRAAKLLSTEEPSTAVSR